MHGIVHSADIQDRYGGVLLMASIFGLFPFLLKLYAQWLSRAQVPAGAEPSLQADQRRNRQALRRGQFVVLPKR